MKLLIAIDLCSKSASVLEGAFNAGVLHVSKCVRIDMKESMVADGVITDATGLQLALSNVLGEYRFRSRSAAVTINSTRIITRDFELPALGETLLSQLVRSEMQQVLGTDKEYGIDYIVRGQTADENHNALYRVQAYAIPKNIIDGCYDLLRALRLKPAAMDIHANSISKLLSGARINGNDPDELFIAASIGHQSMELHVFRRGVQPFSRTTASPLSDFLKEYANTLRCEAADLDVSEIRFTDYSQDNPILAEARRSFQLRIADELQRFLQFVIPHNPGVPISRICLCGSISRFSDFDTALSITLNMPVEMLHFVPGVSLPRGASLSMVAYAAGALSRV